MQNPLFKFDSFVAEARDLWATAPDLVLSQHFYERWELRENPKPFRLDGDSFEFCGQTFFIPQEEEEGEDALPQPTPVAYFEWNQQEQCPCLVIQVASGEKRFLITLDGHCEPQVD